MRTLIVSDIHSNIVAFDAVLRDAQKRGPVDNIWSLGDMVGYGPRPNECLDTLRGFEHISVAGNHDLGAIGATSLSMFNQEARDGLRVERRAVDREQPRVSARTAQRRQGGGFHTGSRLLA